MGHSMTESYEQWKRRELRAALQRLKLEDRLPESYDDGRPSLHKYSVKGDPLLKRLRQFHREK